MGGIDAYGTVLIEGVGPSESGAHAGVLHLSESVHLTRDAFPSGFGNVLIGSAVNPSFVDGMCDAVDIHGARAGLEIGFGLVEKLVPESVRGLIGNDSFYELLQQRKKFVAALHVLGKRVKHVAQREHRPAVGASPVI